MVSNAKEDFPLPETPVMTINLFLGIKTSMCFRLLRCAFLMKTCVFISISVIEP